MFENLSQKLEAVFKKLRGHGKITEENIAESLREVRRVLLDADVNLQVAKQFIDNVHLRAVARKFSPVSHQGNRSSRSSMMNW